MKKQETSSVLSVCSALAASLPVSSLPVFAISEDFESDDVVTVFTILIPQSISAPTVQPK